MAGSHASERRFAHFRDIAEEHLVLLAMEILLLQVLETDHGITITLHSHLV
jgi:hypothetical protein